MTKFSVLQHDSQEPNQAKATGPAADCSCLALAVQSLQCADEKDSLSSCSTKRSCCLTEGGPAFF